MEAVEDALLEGDRTFTPGTARSAFSHRTFRIVYLGAFASNIGTWMQNVVLGALAYDLTGSGIFVGIVTAAQLGPLLLLSLVGGALADAHDRRKLLMVLSVQQAVFSILLALVAISPDPNKVVLVAVVLAIGCGNALYAPTFSAVVPILVPRSDLAGAISLNSVQMNASRVIGPIIGSVLFASFGASWVFVLNAVSFAAVIISLTRVVAPQAGRVRDPGPAPPAGGHLLRPLPPGRRPGHHHHHRLLLPGPALHHPDAEAGRRELRHRVPQHGLRPALRHLRARRGDRRPVGRHPLRRRGTRPAWPGPAWPGSPPCWPCSRSCGPRPSPTRPSTRSAPSTSS